LKDIASVTTTLTDKHRPAAMVSMSCIREAVQALYNNWLFIPVVC